MPFFRFRNNIFLGGLCIRETRAFFVSFFPKKRKWGFPSFCLLFLKKKILMGCLLKFSLRDKIKKIKIIKIIKNKFNQIDS
jgi:hypothetical protein